MNESFVPASSYLAKVDYDSVMHKMTVTFKNGSQTMYQYVFPPTFEAFKLAPSHGKHFATQIKGKLLSLALVKHNVGQAKSTPLHKHKLERGLNNGQRISGHSRKGLEHGLTRILRTAGLIPSSLRHKGGKGIS